MSELDKDLALAYLARMRPKSYPKVVGWMAVIATCTAVPTAIFGVYSSISMVVLLPDLLALWVFALYLMLSREIRVKTSDFVHSNILFSYYLFMGCCFAFIVASLVISAFKLLSSIVTIPAIYLVVAFIVSIIAGICIYYSDARSTRIGYIAANSTKATIRKVRAITAVVGGMGFLISQMLSGRVPAGSISVAGFALVLYLLALACAFTVALFLRKIIIIQQLRQMEDSSRTTNKFAQQ